MPRIWAFCRRNERSRAGYRRRGYTLIEILVVLVLLSLVAGIAAPLGLRTLRNAETRAMERKLGAVLDDLPQRAFRRGEPLTVDADALAREVELAADQGELRLPQPLRYRADGSAEGGELQWLRPGDPVRRWRITPLSGEARLQP